MLTKKDYCDYETCVDLKELGYNQYTSLRSYAGKGGVRLWDFDGEPNYKEGELIALSDMYDIPMDGNEVAAPSLYDAQKWLRERKKLHVEVSIFANNYDVEIISTKGDKHGYHNVFIEKCGFKSYEEALLEGIKAAVEILKEK